MGNSKQRLTGFKKPKGTFFKINFLTLICSFFELKKGAEKTSSIDRQK